MTEPVKQSACSVGVVIIGRNEGDRLDRCLSSVIDVVHPDFIVYVDSDSSDGSPAVADRWGVAVERLNDDALTAARGRQRGTDVILARHPDLEFIQFIDGDCVLHPDWIETAQRYLEANPRVGGVSGRRREERCADNAWSRLLDIDWDLPAGDALHVGGDSLVRVTTLREIGGWREHLIAGEDPDLGFRMIDADWRVSRLADEMTTHDAAMTSFVQYWRRAMRSGHAYAEVGWQHRRGAGRGWWRRTLGIVTYTVGTLLALIAAMWWWPLLIVIALVWARLMFVLFRHARGKNASRSLAVRYAACNGICKFANLIGILQYWLGRVRGERVTLIEYKPHPTS